MTRTPLIIFGIIVLWAAGPRPGASAELKPETVAAWERYVRETETRVARELSDRRRFLTLEFSGRASAVRRAVLGGELVIRRSETVQGDGAAIEVPNGTVHHWRAAVLVPGITLERLIAALRDPHLHGYQPPDVLKRRLIARRHDRERVYLQIQRRGIVTAVFNTEHAVEFSAHAPGRASSRSVSTRIAEVADAGTPRARELPAGQDRGFLWRLNSYWRYEEVPGGVIVELESLSLSRSVPFVLAAVARPLITRVARESIERTLSGIREQLGRPAQSAGIPPPEPPVQRPGSGRM